MQTDILRAIEKLDLPFPWESNAQGQIIMTPGNYNHSHNVIRLARLLDRIAPEWESGMELGIVTSDGVKAPDLIFASPAYHEQHKGKDGYVGEAPEICVEVMSPANSWREMLEKMPLYFEVGAQEVWVVDTGGSVFFFGAGSEKLEKSRLIPDAPEKI